MGESPPRSLLRVAKSGNARNWRDRFQQYSARARIDSATIVGLGSIDVIDYNHDFFTGSLMTKIFWEVGSMNFTQRLGVL